MLYAAAFETLLAELTLLAEMPADPTALRALVAHYRALQQRASSYVASAPAASAPAASAPAASASAASAPAASAPAASAPTVSTLPRPTPSIRTRLPVRMASGQEPIPAQAGIPIVCRPPRPWQPAQAARPAADAGFIGDQDMLAASRREPQISAHELEQLARLMRKFSDLEGSAEADTLLAHFECAGLADE